jgi:GNAT superfamily N-acetyltransferase
VVSANLRIEHATEQDIGLILEFIRGLAVFENLTGDFKVTEQRIREGIFGLNPKAKVLIAYHADLPAGYAVYYYTFSTFVGLPGLYLEDLFVKPEFRSFGIGRALMRELAKLAKRENCFRIEWAVLHWNENAIRFYKSLGAIVNDEWSVYRLSEAPLEALAAED